MDNIWNIYMKCVLTLHLSRLSLIIRYRYSWFISHLEKIRRFALIVLFFFSGRFFLIIIIYFYYNYYYTYILLSLFIYLFHLLLELNLHHTKRIHITTCRNKHKNSWGYIYAWIRLATYNKRKGRWTVDGSTLQDTWLSQSD